MSWQIQQMMQQMMSQLQQQPSWGGYHWPKGKGKGKGQYKGKGKGDAKDKAYKGKGKGGAMQKDKDQSVDDLVCKCCGKKGHLKSQCHHLGKQCGICGIFGHMQSVCRHRKQNQGGQDDSKDDSLGDKQADKEQRMCPECYVWQPDIHKQKCISVGCDHTWMKKSFKDALVPPQQPSAITKNTQQVIDQKDPAKLQEEQEKLEAEIAEYEKDITKYKAKKFLFGEKPFDTSGMEQTLEVLKGKRCSVTNAAQVVKAITGDQIREDKNYEHKMSKMKEDLEKLKVKVGKDEEKHKEAVKQEDERHLKAKAKNEEAFEEIKEQTKEKIKNLEKKIKEEDEQHKAKSEGLADTLVKKGGSQIAAAIDNAAMTAVGAVTLETSEEAIKSHFLADAAVLGAGLNDSQAGAVTKSVSEWARKQKRIMRRQIKMELRKKHGTIHPDAEGEDGSESESEAEMLEEEENEEGGTFTPAGSAKSRSRRRRNPETIIDDTDTRKQAEKRSAEAVGSTTVENAKKSSAIEAGGEEQPDQEKAENEEL